MKWYVWLPWILFILTIAGFVVWYFIQKTKTANIRLELEKVEKETQIKITILEAEAEARIKEQEAKTKETLDRLEQTYRTQLNDLSKRARSEYSKIKKNPQSGIDFILDFLNEGSSN